MPMPQDADAGSASPQSPQDSQPANAPEENQEQGPGAALGELQKALFSVNSAVSDSPQVPKEAKMHLKNAYTEYSAFVSIMGKALGVSMPDMGQQAQRMGNQSAEAQGQSGAVPAGMPSRPGAIPA